MTGSRKDRGGAGGTIGAGIGYKSSADGHTLLWCSVTTRGVAQLLYAKRPYDPIRVERSQPSRFAWPYT